MPWKKKFSYRQKTCYAITKLSSWSTLSPMMANSKCLENSITAEQVLKTEWCFSPMQEENLFHSKMVHVRAGYLKSYWTCGDPHTCMWACRVEELCWGEQTAIQKAKGADCTMCSLPCAQRNSAALEANALLPFPPRGQSSASIPNWTICFSFKSSIPEHNCISAYEILYKFYVDISTFLLWRYVYKCVHT